MVSWGLVFRYGSGTGAGCRPTCKHRHAQERRSSSSVTMLSLTLPDDDVGPLSLMAPTRASRLCSASPRRRGMSI